MDDVYKWAVHTVGVSADNAEILRVQEITGTTFSTCTDCHQGKRLLRLTAKSFERWGILGGPASDLDEAVKELRVTTGMYKGAECHGKSWVFGPSVASNHYHVPFEKLQLHELEERVSTGGCALVQGPFRSGKTSHLHALCRSISERYIPIVYVQRKLE